MVIDPETGKPKKDPKTQTPFEELVNINDIEALPDGPEKEMRLKALKPIRQNLMPMPDFVLCCNNICNCMTKWYENIARIHNIPPVSYTHLDVYKRQSFNSFTFSGFGFAAGTFRTCRF